MRHVSHRQFYQFGCQNSSFSSAEVIPHNGYTYRPTAMPNQEVSQYLWRYLQQKGPRYTKTKWQSVWLVSMFTDAHLHYTAFELLESVDNQATYLQSIFLPCNLFVKRGTSQLTTIFIEQFEGSMPENPKWPPRHWVSEWVIKFNGLSRTADSEVHIVHISRVFIACTLKSLSYPHIDNTQSTSYNNF